MDMDSRLTTLVKMIKKWFHKDLFKESNSKSFHLNKIVED